LSTSSPVRNFNLRMEKRHWHCGASGAFIFLN
jgi:hypothetical protein